MWEWNRLSKLITGSRERLLRAPDEILSQAQNESMSQASNENSTETIVLYKDSGLWPLVLCRDVGDISVLRGPVDISDIKLPIGDNKRHFLRSRQDKKLGKWTTCKEKMVGLFSSKWQSVFFQLHAFWE